MVGPPDRPTAQPQRLAVVIVAREMEHVRMLAEGDLHRPVMVFAFTGWNDAGEGASKALRSMVTHWQATPLAEVDPEPFTDFATVRPTVYLEDGRRHIRWPTVRVFSASLPGSDVIFVLGPEPALRWRMFAEQIVGLANRFGVSMAISLGALLADVPHTHPVKVIGTASDPELIDRFELHPPTYEGPTGIVGVIHDAFGDAGTPSASLWATVPGYAAQIPSPKACEALMRVSCSMIGTTLPVGGFSRAVAEYEARVAALVADNDDLASYVSRLETLMADDLDDDDGHGDVIGGDDDTATPGERPLTLGAEEVDPQTFVAEVEQFLRESGGDETPGATEPDR